MVDAAIAREMVRRLQVPLSLGPMTLAEAEGLALSLTRDFRHPADLDLRSKIIRQLNAEFPSFEWKLVANEFGDATVTVIVLEGS